MSYFKNQAKKDGFWHDKKPFVKDPEEADDNEGEDDEDLELAEGEQDKSKEKTIAGQYEIEDLAEEEDAEKTPKKPGRVPMVPKTILLGDAETAGKALGKNKRCGIFHGGLIFPRWKIIKKVFQLLKNVFNGF